MELKKISRISLAFGLGLFGTLVHLGLTKLLLLTMQTYPRLSEYFNNSTGLTTDRINTSINTPILLILFVLLVVFYTILFYQGIKGESK